MKRYGWLLACSTLLCLVVMLQRTRGDDGVSQTPPIVDPGRPTGYSAPSDSRSLYFPEAGIVKKMLVNEGDPVKVGQLLAEQDSDIEQITYTSMEIDSKSTAKIEAQTAEHELKQVMYNRVLNAYKSNSAAPLQEVDEARVNAQIAEIEIKFAEEEHQRKLVDLDKQKQRIDKMKLVSPIDGIVQKISVHTGEMAEPGKTDGVLTIVQTQPLWIIVQVSTAQAARLKLSDTIQVSSEDDPSRLMNAKLIFFDPVEDPTSKHEMIRLKLDNPQGKRAGLWFNIRLPS